ncbi:aromatic acid/H+ symport family MFS transporter, partial [Klebsiella pneumoniae]
PLRATAASTRHAARTPAPGPLGGGKGVLILGAQMDKINPNTLVAVARLMTGVIVCLVGYSTSRLELLGVRVFIAGSI